MEKSEYVFIKKIVTKGQQLLCEILLKCVLLIMLENYNIQFSSSIAKTEFFFKNQSTGWNCCTASHQTTSDKLRHF